MKRRRRITTEQLHGEAMRMADTADLMHRDPRAAGVARALGMPLASAEAIYCGAAILELVSARATPAEHRRTRAILFRSAAWLAFKGGRLGQAEQIAYEGLREPRLEGWAREELCEVLVEAAKRSGRNPPLIALPDPAPVPATKPRRRQRKRRRSPPAALIQDRHEPADQSAELDFVAGDLMDNGLLEVLDRYERTGVGRGVLRSGLAVEIVAPARLPPPPPRLAIAAGPSARIFCECGEVTIVDAGAPDGPCAGCGAAEGRS